MYADAFVIPVPKRNVAAYRRIATIAGKVWREHGALDYKECVAEDMSTDCGIPFAKLAGCKRGETVIVAWIVYKSRAHRDRVNAKVMKDPRITSIGPKKMPFDMKRMSYGGFKVLVDAAAGK
jgi:uncharacterized protein YbaA (DUF1428 family)